MTEAVIAAVIFALLLALGLSEIRKYRAAQLDSEAIEYPKKRLNRRLLIGVLVLADILALVFMPDGMKPLYAFSYIGVCTVLLIVIVRLAGRDLRETSVSVVKTHEQFKRKSEAELESAFHEAFQKNKKKKKKRK